MVYVLISYFLGLLTWWLSSKGFEASLILVLMPLLLIGMKVDTKGKE